MRKTVLMLDHEPMLIDRRIVLEGKSLVESGYTVYLATRGDGKKPSVENVHGIEVRRFCDSQEEAISDPKSPAGRREAARQKIESWIRCAGNYTLEKKIRGSQPTLLNSIGYALAWPPALAHVLRLRLPILKRWLGRAFEPLVYMGILRFDFVAPYFTLAFYLIKNPAKKLGDSPADDENSWEYKLKTYAMALKPDIVHAHDLPNLEMGCQLAEQLKAVLIYDAHELYPFQYFSDEKQKIKLLNLERRLIGRADAVISVNQQCVDVLCREYGISNAIPVTNATESPPNFDPLERKKKWHETFALPETVRIMVFQGGINPVRNVDPLVQALVHCDENIHIGFITYKKDVPYYEQMTRSLGVHHRVHYILEIPWDEVNDWLASADVGVMPYQVTNFNAQIASPNKLYEFVVAGLPIIASSDLVNVRKAVEEDDLGIVTLLKEVDSYIWLIKAMFDHPEGPERFRSSVLAARHKYLWSNESPKVLACYEKISDINFVPKAVANAQ